MMSNAEDFVKYQYEMAELQGKTAVWSNVFDNGKGIDASDFIQEFMDVSIANMEMLMASTGKMKYLEVQP